MYIRKYNNEDYTTVNKIITDNFEHRLEPFAYDDGVDQYVCLLDDNIVGYFVLTKIKNVVRNFYYYLLDYFCVDIDHQGMGIGSEMMKYLTDKADQEDIEYIQLTCSNKRSCAKHLYEKFDFVVKDTNVFRRVKK